MNRRQRPPDRLAAVAVTVAASILLMTAAGAVLALWGAR